MNVPVVAPPKSTLTVKAHAGVQAITTTDAKINSNIFLLAATSPLRNIVTVDAALAKIMFKIKAVRLEVQD